MDDFVDVQGEMCSFGLHSVSQPATSQRRLCNRQTLHFYAGHAHLLIIDSHTFTSAAPVIWNSLSVSTRPTNSICAFRSRLKTVLFANVYVT